MTKESRVLPLSRLAGACADQLAVVAAEWPDGIPLTEETVERVLALGLDLDWAAGRLLSTPELVEYGRVTAPAWAEYQRATAPSLAEYQRATAMARAEFERATAPALLAALVRD